MMIGRLFPPMFFAAQLLVWGGCGAATGVTDAGLDDAGVDTRTDAWADRSDWPLDDGGWPAVAVLWSRPRVVSLECLSLMCDFYPCDWQPPVILLRVKVEPTGFFLRGGTGSQVGDAGSTYSFVDEFKPSVAMVETSLPQVADGGSAYTPFATSSTFQWVFRFIQDQPPLEISRAVVTGSLDADGLPRSQVPPRVGRYLGCFTPESAEAIYLEFLSQNLRQLMSSAGCQLDCDSSGDGSPDSYTLELEWEGAEVVRLLHSNVDGGP